MILLHEQDARFHAVDFAKEKAAAPGDLKKVFDDVESVPWRRRAFERDAVLHELCRRAGADYEEHFVQRRKREHDASRLSRNQSSRRCSAVSAQASWFDTKYCWFRVLFTLHITLASLYSARWATCAMAGMGRAAHPRHRARCPPRRVQAGECDVERKKHAEPAVFGVEP